MASEAFRVKMRGRVRVAFLNTWPNRIRLTGAPITLADSTNGSAFSRMVSARITRKYWGMNTTVIEMAAARMPTNAPDLPPLMTMDNTMASRRDGKA